VANQARTFQSRRYGLELEGVLVGSIASFAGGDATADVVVEEVGQDGVAHKHLGAVKYEDIRFSCGADMADSFYDWLQQTFSGGVSRKNGAVITYDSNFNEVSRLSFFNGMVSEIGFPTVDGSSKDVAKLTIKISPEHTSNDPGNSSVGSILPNRKKPWMSGNFRLAIGGVDYDRVGRVEAVTVSRSVAPGTAGGSSDKRNESTYMVVSDLMFTLPELSTDAGTTALRKWFNSFVIAGINGQEQEKNGTLEYLASDLKTSLFTLDLRQLGVYRLSRLDDPGENIQRIQARMYCEQIVFSYAPAANQSSGASSDNPALHPTLTLVASPFLQNLSATPANQAGSSPPSQPPRIVPTAASRAPRNLTAAQGPQNLPPVQQQTFVPSLQPRVSLAFRNLSQ
jgi:phage tail-like protein